MSTWFEETITPDDDYLVKQARLEINVYRRHLCSLLDEYLTRIQAWRDWEAA